MSNVIELKKYPRRFEGDLGPVHFVARTAPSPASRGNVRKCLTCGRRTRRSWRTGILWNRCGICRHLMMIYGSNIEVEPLKGER